MRVTTVSGPMIFILLLVVLAEGGSFLLGKYFIPGSRVSFVLYDPGFEPKEKDVARYFEQRDRLLGWPPKDAYGTERYDLTGARPIPGFPSSAEACVAVYGDSYAYSSHVDAADAWSSLLSHRLGCRVANYGVSGYGTDQAFLRFLHNAGERPGVAMLGVATVDIIRLVNQDRSLFAPAKQGLLLKPRFVELDDGALRLIEIPAVTTEAVVPYIRFPARFLLHEWFLPGTRDGPVSLQFPYSFALLRAMMNPRVKNKLQGKPSWIDFYEPTHPSGALSLLLRITEEFVRVAAERGMRHLVLIIPTSQDLIYAREEGVDPSAGYVEALREQGIENLNVLPPMLRHIGGDDVCRVFSQKTWLGYCWGHYNPEGERVIADLIHERLQQIAGGGN